MSWATQYPMTEDEYESQKGMPQCVEFQMKLDEVLRCRGTRRTAKRDELVYFFCNSTWWASMDMQSGLMSYVREKDREIEQLLKAKRAEPKKEEPVTEVCVPTLEETVKQLEIRVKKLEEHVKT